MAIKHIILGSLAVLLLFLMGCATQQQEVTEEGILIEFFDADGNVLHTQTYSTVAPTITQLLAFEGIPESNIQRITENLGRDISDPLVAGMNITFNVKNDGNVPVEVRFTEGVVEASYFD